MTILQDPLQQTFSEWIDEEKVEEFNEFLDNQLQSKLGRGFNASAAQTRPASGLALLISTILIVLLLYDE